MQYCSLQHRTLLPSPITSTTGCCFCFGSVSIISGVISPLFSILENISAYCTPTNLGSSSFSVLSFCLFILFMGFSRHKYRSGLPLPSAENHVLSELSTMTCPSWFLTETEDIKKWQEYTEELYKKKDLRDPNNHNGVIAHLKPDSLE